MARVRAPGPPGLHARRTTRREISSSESSISSTSDMMMAPSSSCSSIHHASSWWRRKTTPSSFHHRPPLAAILLLLLLAAAGAPRAARAQTWRAALRQFEPRNDIPAQRAALETFYSELRGGASLLATPAGAGSGVVGNPGLVPWRAPNASYCTWWGVNCCGATLTASLAVCAHGPNSVSGLHVAGVGLAGRLPDVFGELPDLQILDISLNRGAFWWFLCWGEREERGGRAPRGVAIWKGF